MADLVEEHIEEKNNRLKAKSVVVSSINDTRDATSSPLHSDASLKDVINNETANMINNTVKVVTDEGKGFCLTQIDTTLLKCDLIDDTCTNTCKSVEIHDFISGSIIKNV